MNAGEPGYIGEGCWRTWPASRWPWEIQGAQPRFLRGKREGEEAESVSEAEVIGGGWHRKKHEWLHSQVSLAGGRKTVQIQAQSDLEDSDHGSGGAKRSTRDWE